MYIRIDNPAWFPHIDRQVCTGVIVGGEIADLKRMSVNDRIMEPWRKQLSIALPPLIADFDKEEWVELCRIFASRGVNRFCITNAAHKELIPPDAELIGDATNVRTFELYQAIKPLPFSAIILNRKEIADNSQKPLLEPSKIWIKLYGHTYDNVSLVNTEKKNSLMHHTNIQKSDSVALRHNCRYFLSRHPLNDLKHRSQLCEQGFCEGMLDLCFIDPDRKLINELIDAYLLH